MMEATPKEWKQMVQSFTSRGASHCDNKTFSFKPRDKNLAAASSNSQRRFYHSSDFDSNHHTKKLQEPFLNSCILFSPH